MEIKKNRIIRIAIIGAGLIGKERIKAINILKKRGRPVELMGILDPYSNEVNLLCKQNNVKPFASIKQIIDSSPDWVILAIPHDVASPTAISMLDASMNILIEKPLGRSFAEAKKIFSHVKFDSQLAVGFNYRFFDGIQRSIIDAKQRVFGDIVSLGIVLGHGGDPNMRNSWKLDPKRAGGGCLLDPGIHLLDLSRLFFDKIPDVIKVISWNGFWKTGIEEECSLLLTSNGSLINLQISIVKWRSTFRMEINGTDGYGIVTGRGKTYGPQTYVRGKRWGWLSSDKTQAESEELVLETNGDEVFANELDALLFDSSKYGVRHCSAKEALQSMELYENCLASL